MIEDLPNPPTSADTVGLLEGLSTTRAIRRYRNEPIPPDVLRDIMFAATRAANGSNRQAFRFIVLTDGPKAAKAKQLISEVARRFWRQKRATDGYDAGSGADPTSPKARTAAAMQAYVDNFPNVPALILPCLVRYREPSSAEGASVYPSCQNILLAARALGYGGVFSGWQSGVEDELRELLNIPDGVFIAGCITLGKPEGNHGPVRRRPMAEVIFEDEWDRPAVWAVDPPGTRFTQAGPPKRR